MDYFFYYTDCAGERIKLFFRPRSYINAMEFIRDQGYEDWGDCRGRAWCATCHIRIKDSENYSEIDSDEKMRLEQLSNLERDSRLCCQILLDENLHGVEIEYIGDD